MCGGGEVGGGVGDCLFTTRLIERRLACTMYVLVLVYCVLCILEAFTT